MSPRARLFVILWLLGFVGVLSFQLVDLQALIAKLPDAQNRPLPFSMGVLRLLSVLQPAILLAVAVLLGWLLAPRIGLSAPGAEAMAEGRPLGPALRPQLLPGLWGGVVGGLGVIASWLLWKNWLPAAFVAQAEEFNRMMPPATRLLYGGITEELFLRWGFMSLVVWAVWKVTQKGGEAVRDACFVTGIAVSAAIFGIGHLPIAIALAGAPTLALISYVVTANSFFGLVAGYLFWKKGLESAMVAHAVTHVVLITVLATTSIDHA